MTEAETQLIKRIVYKGTQLGINPEQIDMLVTAIFDGPEEEVTEALVAAWQEALAKLKL